MKNALILHGTSSNSRANWFPWLKEELEGRGFKVWVPDLPEADEPNLECYEEFIFPNFEFNQESVLIGHSSGAAAILGLVQDMPFSGSIEKAVLVGGFEENLGPGWEKLNGLFVRPFDFELIKSRCREFVFVQSDNDPHVPLEHGQTLKKLLGGQLVVLHKQGHFNTDTMGDRYRRFPELINYL